MEQPKDKNDANNITSAAENYVDNRGNSSSATAGRPIGNPEYTGARDIITRGNDLTEPSATGV